MATRDYSPGEVAELLGLSVAEVRRCVRDGFLTSSTNELGQARLSFQDLVLLRRAAELIRARVRPHRVRRALKSLKDQLPDGVPLSGVQVSAEGNALLARSGERLWNPLSGQLHLDFQAVRTPVPSPLAPPTNAPRLDERIAQAIAIYDEACDLEDAGKPGDAAAAYRRALTLDATLLDARVNLGRILHEQGELRASESEYQRVLASGPHALASFNLAVVFEDQSRIDEAIAAYNAAIAADPDCEDAYFNLSRLHERRGDRALALRALKAYRGLTH